jgi:hypothetical protein
VQGITRKSNHLTCRRSHYEHINLHDKIRFILFTILTVSVALHPETMSADSQHSVVTVLPLQHVTWTIPATIVSPFINSKYHVYHVFVMQVYLFSLIANESETDTRIVTMSPPTRTVRSTISFFQSAHRRASSVTSSALCRAPIKRLAPLRDTFLSIDFETLRP